MDYAMNSKMSMPEGQLLMVLKEIYGSHAQWHGVQLQRVQMLVCRVEEIEREECARAAGIAFLGAEKELSDRVLKAICTRGNK